MALNTEQFLNIITLKLKETPQFVKIHTAFMLNLIKQDESYKKGFRIVEMNIEISCIHVYASYLAFHR